MENFVKICEIITDTAEDTNTIMELLKKEAWAAFYATLCSLTVVRKP